MSGLAQDRRGKPLSARFVETVKAPGKYHDNGGAGLFLLVKPDGSRFWMQRTTVAGKRREIGLGSPPTVSLADARTAATANKLAIRNGADPVAERRRAAAEAKAAAEAERRRAVTFEEATRRAHAELASTWKNPKDAAAFLSTIEKWLWPKVGKATPVADVKAADLRAAILEAREAAPEVARKLSFRAAAVFRWAIAEGLRADNPATAEALALPKLTKAKKHFAALPYTDVSDCIATVGASGAFPSTKLALEFLVLTASRSGEVRGARWSEIDREAAVWTVPAERMKMGKPHRVPLTPRALAILDEAESLADGSGLVFPSPRGKSLSDMTLSKLLKDLGYEVTVHGFRSSFRTWAQEQTRFPHEIAEAALAHQTGDAVVRAYARSDTLDKRRKLMAAWSDFLAGSRSAKVVALASAR